ncbi:MAG: phosphoribosylglycinamide formyltransferase [Thermoguttaceae bacterium]|jgi:phosphoribosylglycinamide formyltransferase-1
MSELLKLAVLISGQGRTLKNILNVIERGELNAKVELVIASKEDCPGLQCAEQRKIPTLVISSDGYESNEDFSEGVFTPITARRVDYVVMAGYLKLLLIPHEYRDRVLNIHPSLIPSFCGKGMYGIGVHQQAIERGVKVTGCTVHFVDNIYDNGPIILQKVIDVHDDDTPETLQTRVLHECEFVAYPQVLRYLSEGRIEVYNRKDCPHRAVRILPPKNTK